MPQSASSSSLSDGVLLGGSLIRRACVFSGDDRLLCVAVESRVRLYAAATGESVGVLECAKQGEAEQARADGSLPGHSRPITRMLPHPTNKLQLYTASLDGSVRLWDLYDQTCVSMWAIKVAADGEGKWERPAVTDMVQGAGDLFYLLVDPHVGHAASHASPQEDGAPAEPVERACRIVLFQLSKSLSHILYKVKDATRLALDPSQRMLACVSGRTLRLFDSHALHRKASWKQRMEHALTCVAFHPTEGYMVVGDARGHLLVLHGFLPSNQQKRELVVQNMHWHAHAVGCVAFTPDGGWMLSAGEEGVLVQWQLSTGSKHFLPRLGGAIKHMALSNDGNTYALSLDSNEVKLVSAVSNKVERVVAGLGYSAPFPGTLGAGEGAHLVSNPSASGAPTVVSRKFTPQAHSDSLRRTLPTCLWSPTHHAWLLPTPSGSGLQLYDLFADRSLGEVDLLHKGVISRTDDDASSQGNQPRLEAVALSSEGKFLVTSERRSGFVASGGGAIHSGAASTSADHLVLKFWAWVPHAAQWVLSTRVDAPHASRPGVGGMPLVALEFHPSLPCAVSVGRDGTFKVWREVGRPRAPNVRKEKQQQQLLKGSDAASAAAAAEEKYWTCTGVGSYRSNYTCSCAAFSQDGSVLAVSYGQVVTLWNVDSLSLKHTILHPSPSDPVGFVRFVPVAAQSPGEEDKVLLVTATAGALYVWNLLTYTLEWSVGLHVLGLATGSAESCANHFAAMVLAPEEEEAVEDPELVEREAREDSQDVEQGEGGVAGAVGEASEVAAAKVPFRRRRTHLLLFRAAEPVPVRVWSMRDARVDSVSSASSAPRFAAPILFAVDATAERAAKKLAAQSGKPAAPAPVSLVYSDYKRQLVRLDDVFNADAQNSSRQALASAGVSSTADAANASAMARMQAQTEEVSLFEQLYGKSARVVRPTSSAVSALTPASGASTFSAVLNGPSHILPPPSALFASLMDGMLAKAVKTSGSNPLHPSQASRNEDDMEDTADAQQSAAHSAPHLSAAALDASLLSADSTSTGALFQWSQHSGLSATFERIIARISDDATRIDDAPVEAEQKSASSSKSAAASSKSAASATSSKRKKTEPAAEAPAAAEAKSKSSSKSPKLNGQPAPAAAAADAMELDEAQPKANGHSKKSSKGKSKQ